MRVCIEIIRQYDAIEARVEQFGPVRCRPGLRKFRACSAHTFGVTITECDHLDPDPVCRFGHVQTPRQAHDSDTHATGIPTERSSLNPPPRRCAESVAVVVAHADHERQLSRSMVITGPVGRFARYCAYLRDSASSPVAPASVCAS